MLIFISTFFFLRFLDNEIKDVSSRDGSFDVKKLNFVGEIL